MGLEVALAAVAVGACVIEKHFTLDRNLPGPDHRASLEPKELEELVRGIRRVEAALGNGTKVPAPEEFEIARVARRSLVVTRNIVAGTVLTHEVIDILRPATGLPPSSYEKIIGRRVVKDIPAGTPLTSEMLA